MKIDRKLTTELLILSNVLLFVSQGTTRLKETLFYLGIVLTVATFVFVKNILLYNNTQKIKDTLKSLVLLTIALYQIFIILTDRVLKSILVQILKGYDQVVRLVIFLSVSFFNFCLSIATKSLTFLINCIHKAWFIFIHALAKTAGFILGLVKSIPSIFKRQRKSKGNSGINIPDVPVKVEYFPTAGHWAFLLALSVFIIFFYYLSFQRFLNSHNGVTMFYVWQGLN